MNNIKIPPLHLDGLIYTPNWIDNLCQPLLDIRATLIDQGRLDYAASMLQIYALLQHLKDHTNE